MIFERRENVLMPDEKKLKALEGRRRFLGVKKVDRPIMFMHICFASQYARSQGEMDSHPRSYEIYEPDELRRFKDGSNIW